METQKLIELHEKAITYLEDMRTAKSGIKALERSQELYRQREGRKSEALQKLIDREYEDLALAETQYNVLRLKLK